MVVRLCFVDTMPRSVDMSIPMAFFPRLMLLYSALCMGYSTVPETCTRREALDERDTTLSRYYRVHRQCSTSKKTTKIPGGAIGTVPLHIAAVELAVLNDSSSLNQS